jgi:hypothetical protein
VRLDLADVDQVLPEVRAAAERALDGASCTVDDLACECREGRALCFYASGWGLVIAKLNPNRRHNDLELEVWLAVSTGPTGAIDEFTPELEIIARRLRATRIVFSSMRPGFMRRPPAGWQMREMTFEREVA